MNKYILENDKLIVDLVSMNYIQDIFSLKNNDSVQTPLSLNSEANPKAFTFFNKNEIFLINRFKTYKRQLEWIAGRFIIKKMIHQLYGEDHSSINIVIKQNGAPFLEKYPQSNISISHSGEFAIGAVSHGKEFKMGVDIEKIKEKYSPEFVNIAFTKNEINHLKDQDFHQVWINWTIKEAYLKFIEEGFHENLKNIEVIDHKIYHCGVLMDHIKIQTETINRDYIYSIVYN